jgi:hypothetical protein
MCFQVQSLPHNTQKKITKGFTNNLTIVMIATTLTKQTTFSVKYKLKLTIFKDDELDEKADREINDDTMSVASSSVASESRLDPDLEVTPYDFS